MPEKAKSEEEARFHTKVRGSVHYPHPLIGDLIDSFSHHKEIKFHPERVIARIDTLVRNHQEEHGSTAQGFWISDSHHHVYVSSNVDAPTIRRIPIKRGLTEAEDEYFERNEVLRRVLVFDPRVKSNNGVFPWHLGEGLLVINGSLELVTREHLAKSIPMFYDLKDRRIIPESAPKHVWFVGALALDVLGLTPPKQKA